MTQAIALLLSKCKALSSNSSTAKKKGRLRIKKEVAKI
jgi:hypothetical protein